MAQRVKALEKREVSLGSVSLPEVMPLAEVMAPEVLARELRVLWALWEITKSLDLDLSEGEVYKRLLDLVGRLVPFTYATLYLLDWTGKVHVAATSGRPIDLVEEISFGPGNGISSWVVERKVPFLVPSDQESPRMGRKSFRDSPLTSFLAVPLVHRSAVLGVVALARDAGRYTREDLHILQRLATSICVVVDRFRREEKYRRLALVDELTGVYNRRYLVERLHQEIKRAERLMRPLSLAMLDLDGFKKLNDTLGHPAGDRALRWLAELLRSGVRSSDVVCRYGGDEFVILMPEASLTSAVQVIERLRRRILEKPLSFSVPGRKARITLKVSFGIASCSDRLLPGEELIAAADRALLEAKLAGGNCYRVAQESTIAKEPQRNLVRDFARDPGKGQGA
ncbi:MAG: sensor domain-containing diguanylate cyclase [Armatimonadota bacterium]|nr:sensor domain-containing diguanylate cyclase [Armatimonadota bacterium]MDR5703375.1 sensor domain-containing diguanylate cyclase [Armatimonadota bacterium]